MVPLPHKVQGLNYHEIRCKYMFMLPLKNLACKGLRTTGTIKPLQNSAQQNHVHILWELLYIMVMIALEVPFAPFYLFPPYQSQMLISSTVFLAATKQLYEWYFLSVCPSVRLSVTPFWLCSHRRIIMKFSGVITTDQGNVHAKGQGQRSRSQRSTANLAVSGL